MTRNPSYLLLFYLFLMLGSVSNAQHSLLRDFFLSDQHLYSYKTVDSLFYRFQRGKIKSQSFSTKVAEFNISNTGLGYVIRKNFEYNEEVQLLPKEIDSMYVSLNKLSGEKYKISHYSFRNNQLGNSDIPPDTVTELSSVLKLEGYNIQFLQISNLLERSPSLTFQDNKISWKDQERNLTIVIDDQNEKHLQSLINKFVLENLIKRKPANTKNLFYVDLIFTVLRVSKQQVDQLIKKLKTGQRVQEEEKEEIAVKFGTGKIVEDLRSEFFINKYKTPSFLSRSGDLFKSNIRIKNIFEINKEGILYSDPADLTGSPDTSIVRIFSIDQNRYVLRHDENNLSFLGRMLGFKSDTLTNIRTALATKQIHIDWIEIRDNIRGVSLLKVDQTDNTIWYKDQPPKRYQKGRAKFRTYINNFLIKNISKEVADRPYEVLISWSDTGLRFFWSKKTAKEFIKAIKKIKRNSPRCP